METTVLIVGGGITGTAISRELSKYEVKVTLIEKETDLAGGATKANTAIIHAGYDDEPGTLVAELCPRGNFLWAKIASELDIPFKRKGSLVVAFEDSETKTLEELMRRGTANNVPSLRILQQKDLLMAEPHLNRKAFAGLYAPTAGIVCPYEATFALAENAKLNGARILLETEATGIRIKDAEVKGVQTNRGTINAEYLVNAAGLFADQISAMAGIKEFKIVPRKGEYVVYDKNLDGLVRHVLFPIPSPMSKGILVSPTIDGNILAGPNAHDVGNKDDLASTSHGLKEVLTGASRLVPRLSRMGGAVITNFAGLRPEPSTGDFVIKSYEDPRGFINVAGIKSPGLTSAPAIALKAVETFKKELKLKEKSHFIPRRESIAHPIREFQPSTDSRKIDEFVAKKPYYGHVVCRCEHVSEEEILEAIHRGATTLDGVKYRTRAGMGRCQGEFCTPRVTAIIGRERKLPFEDVTKNGGSSQIVLYRPKQLLTGDQVA